MYFCIKSGVDVQIRKKGLYFIVYCYFKKVIKVLSKEKKNNTLT